MYEVIYLSLHNTGLYTNIVYKDAVGSDGLKVHCS